MSQPARRRLAAPRSRHSEQVADDAGLRALLDHLGRLLAHEYLQRLRETPRPGTGGKEEN
jgi:hypothetical protein